MKTIITYKATDEMTEHEVEFEDVMPTFDPQGDALDLHDDDMNIVMDEIRMSSVKRVVWEP